MGKYLDSSGVTYLWGKIKGLFTDNSLNTKEKTYAKAINEINTKVNNLTGAFVWKGSFETEADKPSAATYNIGDVIGVAHKEYVCTEVNGAKTWVEFGDEANHITKDFAESTYLKKTAGAVGTTNLSDNAVTSAKLAVGARNPIILVDDPNEEYIEIDEETYDKLLDFNADVDVLLRTISSDFCNLVSRNLYGDETITLRFAGFSIGDTSTYLEYYDADITYTVPHRVTITTRYKGEFDKFLEDTLGFTPKNKLTPILKEIDLTGTDADRKAKLDQFEADWKALTGASDLSGARFVGHWSLDSGNGQSLFNYDTLVIGGYVSIAQDANSHFIHLALDDSDGSLTITPLFSHLEAITIYVDNTEEHMQQNLDNIAAYEANLQALGVDTTKSPMIPIVFNEGPDSYLEYSGSGYISHNGNYYSGYAVIGDSDVYMSIQINKEPDDTSRNGTFKYQVLASSLEVSSKVDKSLNAKSLEAVTIKTSNSPDDKAANVAAINAYVNNLKSLGVDVTKGYYIPFREEAGIRGFLIYNPASLVYTILGASGDQLLCIGYMDGGHVLYVTPVQLQKDTNLTTTSKQIVGAINEVNAAVKTKAANIKDATATGSLVQNTSTALSEDSIALGNGTLAGTMGLKWTAIDFTNNAITLANPLVSSIGAGALISIINDKHYDKCSEVAETAAKGATTLKVKSLPFTSIAEDTGDDAKTLMVYSNPMAGDIDLGLGAHSEGINTKATQRASHAEGRDTYAAGQYSHAEGRETEAFYASHAEGRGSKATGDVSHAEGLGTFALGDHTHAEGQNTHAVGLNAHAEGLRGWANGQHSHVEGVDTVTSNTAEHAEGKFNKSNKAADSFGSGGNTLHSIGIGTSADDRKNALEVMQSGEIYVFGIGGYDGTNASDYASLSPLHEVIGDLESMGLGGAHTASTKSYLLGKDSGSMVYNEAVYMQNGSIFGSSDERLKDFGDDIPCDLDKIAKLPKKFFTWKNDDEKHQMIGTSAQAVRKLYPELVSEDEDGKLGVAYDKLAIVALAAVDKLHEENNELKERLARIEEKLEM